MPKEIEIRAVVSEPEAVKEALVRLGFHYGGESVQVDIMLDLPDGRLFNSGRKLRVRTEGDMAELTYKGFFEGDSTASRRIEVNVPIRKEDLDTLVTIFSAIGYPPLFTIPKKRVTYTDRNTTVTFDDWPIIGCLMELEGEEQVVRELARVVAPSEEFANHRLKDLFLRAEKESGRTLQDLQEEYEKEHGVLLGRLDILLN